MGEVHTVQFDEDAQKLKKITRKIKKSMQELNTYSREYDIVIEKLADLLMLYEKLMEQIRAADYSVVSETAAGGKKKSAVFAALNDVLKQIATYSDRLCLNPKAMIGTDGAEKKQESKLDAVLSGMKW